jgi:hypothetical protein
LAGAGLPGKGGWDDTELPKPGSRTLRTQGNAKGAEKTVNKEENAIE